MTATKWSKGDRVKLTTTTAGPELLEIVGFRRTLRRQYVVLADARTADRIRAGEVDARTVVLTGIGGRVREIETQRFHRLADRGLAVHV
jgi:DICT domain-containing protein